MKRSFWGDDILLFEPHVLLSNLTHKNYRVLLRFHQPFDVTLLVHCLELKNLTQIRYQQLKKRSLGILLAPHFLLLMRFVRFREHLNISFHLLESNFAFGASQTAFFDVYPELNTLDQKYLQLR